MSTVLEINDLRIRFRVKSSLEALLQRIEDPFIDAVRKVSFKVEEGEKYTFGKITFIGNTIDGENVTGSHGVNSSTQTTGIYIDNIFYDCDTALNLGTAPINIGMIVANNLFNSNNLNYPANHSTIYSYQLGEVTTPPSFSDEAGDDYTLNPDSPAIDAGLEPGGIT